jgi:RHS repeat-associated protein
MSISAASNLISQFTGKERDESGLEYFGARYYSPSQGRFSSPDAGAKGIVPSHPQTWNKYAYVVNNPLAYKDINGEWPWYVHNEMLDLAFGNVLSGDELKQLKNVNWAMDFGPGQQDPSKSNEHSMCAPGQGTAACLGGIENVLFTDMQAASVFPRSTALSIVGQAMHTIADWTSPTHVSDSGIPYTWNAPPIFSGTFIGHIKGEASMYANPGRYYLGVQLMVSMYLKRFPEETGKFKNLNSWIMQDARRRAYSLMPPEIPSSSFDYFSWSKERDQMAERMAQCWAGNPAACPD